MSLRTGGQILVDQLKIHGTSHVFCVPGESYLAVLDALHDVDIKTIVCRQEGGAAYMAEAAGKITGQPGIVMVTRRPGATNASCGIHVASQDSTPLIMFVGQVARDMKEREAFQELDYKAVFGTMAKWVVEIDRARAIASTVQAAAPADVILLAGKGHEDHQEIEGVRTPFDDRVHARRALDERAGA